MPRLPGKMLLPVILLLCLSLLSGCRRDSSPPSSDSSSSGSLPAETPDYPVDVFGIEVDSQPVRVVSLSPAVTELLCAFGYGDRLFGVSDACDYPEMVLGMSQCGSSLLPDIDQIAEISPDFLITESPLQQDDYWALVNLDIDVVEISAPQDFAQIMDLYRDICTLMDGASSGTQTGEMLADLYTQQIAVLQEKVTADPLGDTLSAVFIIDESGVVATGGTFYHEILSALGLINLAEDGDRVVTSFEGKQPDLILYGDRVSREDIVQSPVFADLEAVQNDKMFSVPLAPLERVSPRMFDMLEQIANQIYTASWD